MTQEEVMTYIAECTNPKHLGDILDNVQDRLELMREVIEGEKIL